MKHVFVINPAAGKENNVAEIQSMLFEYGKGYDWEIYVTRAPGDATEFVRKRAKAEKDSIRFYACGGDGTLNEVATGALGFDNASIGVYPCGSGNDYVKHFGGKAAFLNIPALLAAPEIPVDLMKLGKHYSINICDFGFDTAVATTMANVKRKAIIGGSNAYTTGVVWALLTAMRSECKIWGDGELLNNGKILLCSLGCGSYVGGSFRCAPRSKCGDGLMEVCIVRPVSRFTFVRLVKKYAAGEHLDEERFKKFITYRRCKKVRIVAPPGFKFSMDGEVISVGSCTIEILPSALRFALPEGAEERGRLFDGVKG